MRMSVALLLALVSLAPAFGDDWPQWMGPKRDNVWRETGVIDAIPKDGAKVVWRAPVAGGYAGPAVVGNRVYVTDFVRQGDLPEGNFERNGFAGTERVLCLDAKSGKEVWKHEYPVNYTVSYPAGPRCTPLVHQGKVYTLGAEGNLFCFDAAKGTVVWQKDLKQEYGTTSPLWGYAAHPLIDGDKLITLAGGQGSQAVALDRETGKELWRTLDTPEIGQGYVPPSIIDAGGVRQLILMTPASLDSVNPETGKPYWSLPYEATNGSIIMTPIVTAGYLFVGGYNGKNLMAKLAADRPAAEALWRDKPRESISPINVQPYPEGDAIFGVDADGLFTAFEVPSGKRLWQNPQPVAARRADSGTAFLIRQGDEGSRVWAFTDSGDLVIADVTKEAYKEVSRAHVIEPTNTAFKPRRRLVLPGLRGQAVLREERRGVRVRGFGGEVRRSAERRFAGGGGTRRGPGLRLRPAGVSPRVAFRMSGSSTVRAARREPRPPVCRVTASAVRPPGRGPRGPR